MKHTTRKAKKIICCFTNTILFNIREAIQRTVGRPFPIKFSTFFGDIYKLLPTCLGLAFEKLGESVNFVEFHIEYILKVVFSDESLALMLLAAQGFILSGLTC